MKALTSQYAEFPGEASQDSGQNEEESKNITKIIYAAIGIVVIIILYFVFFSGSGRQPDNDYSGSIESPSKEDALAGNNAKNSTPAKSETAIKCIPPENCFDNPDVCKCSNGEYCSNETKKCVAAVCGNGKCEPNEYADTCCDDCGCAYKDCSVCSAKVHKCIVPEASISDDVAIGAAQRYFLDKGLAVENISVEGSVCFNSSVSKLVAAKISGSGQIRELRVLESGEVNAFYRL
jgi:hypothetical protein